MWETKRAKGISKKRRPAEARRKSEKCRITQEARSSYKLDPANSKRKNGEEKVMWYVIEARQREGSKAQGKMERKVIDRLWEAGERN